MGNENKVKITKENLTIGTTIFFIENELDEDTGEILFTNLIKSVINYVYENNNCINVYRIDTNSFEDISLERIYTFKNPNLLSNSSDKKFHIGEIVKFKNCNKKFVVSKTSDKYDMVCIYEIEFGPKISEDISLYVRSDLLEHVEESSHIIVGTSKSFKDNSKPYKDYSSYPFGIAVRVIDGYNNLKKYKIIIIQNMEWYHIKICLTEEYSDSILMCLLHIVFQFNPFKNFSPLK